MFSAHKKELLMDMGPESGGSLVATLEERTAVRQIYLGWEFPISPNLPGFFSMP